MTHPQPYPPNQGGPGRLWVLIVEDHADAAQSIKRPLEVDGHEVYVATDGNSGLEAADNAVRVWVDHGGKLR
jgi:CheY-like chemotaxis protein